MYIHSLLMTENKFWLDNNTYINSQKRLIKLFTVLNILVVWNQKQSKTHTSYQIHSLIFSFLQGYNIFLYTCSNQNWMSSSKNGRNNSVNIKFWNRRQNFLTCCLASIFNILCDRHSKSLILPYVNPFLTKQFFTRVYCRNENMRERNWYEVCVFDCFCLILRNFTCKKTKINTFLCKLNKM
jgi:hypothetical protein